MSGENFLRKLLSTPVEEISQALQVGAARAVPARCVLALLAHGRGGWMRALGKLLPQYKLCGAG